MMQTLKSGATVSRRANDNRLFLSHGPINLVIEAFGDVREVSRSYKQAIRRFDGLLQELVEELSVLRSPNAARWASLASPVARRMRHAVKPHGQTFVTPMAAVAGSVADEVLDFMIKGRNLSRAYVNNGGDIALYLAPAEQFKTAVVSDLAHPKIAAKIQVSSAKPVRGIATSGWQGRSKSFGIADAVTVLADDAATADICATLIANAVDLPVSKKIKREKANTILPDSDLGERLITTEVSNLSNAEKEKALAAGQSFAKKLCDRGMISASFLSLQGMNRVVDQHNLLVQEERQVAYA